MRSNLAGPHPMSSVQKVDVDLNKVTEPQKEGFKYSAPCCVAVLITSVALVLSLAAAITSLVLTIMTRNGDYFHELI